MSTSSEEHQAWSESMVGRTLADRYRIDGVIGIGAMGTVFRARHLALDRDVALKLLNAQLTAHAEMRARFSREAAAVSKLDHPNCVRVTDFGVTDDGHHFLVMELLEGVELADMLDAPLPPERALSIMAQILAGLEHAHGKGLVHRDVKPENIFMARYSDGREVAKLLDFGIVKLEDKSSAQPLTRFGMVFGTPLYMSPEQAAGQPTDGRTDLYSAGVILYTMLAGRPPFDADDPVKLLRMQMKEPPPPLPASIPAPVRRFVERLLAKRPDERYPNATETRRVLERIVEDLAKPADARSKPTLAAGLGGLGNRNTLLAAGGVGAALLIAIVVTLSSGSNDDENGSSAASDSPTGASAQASKSSEAAPTEDPGASTNDENAAAEQGENDRGERALEANLAAIDALMAAKKHDAAQIALTPLLTSYPDEPQLHWRMGQVLTRLGGAERRAQALQSYRQALALSPDLLTNEVLAAELGALLDDPKLRSAAVELTIDLLGDEGHDRLLGWLNTQSAPLPRSTRHRIIAHLEAGRRGQEINRPLQHALDLWQAASADDPCKAFEQALAAVTEHPDSYLLGTLQTVQVPTASADADGGACPGLADALASARRQHEQRFAGIDGVVPKAFRKSKPAPQQSRRRR